MIPAITWVNNDAVHWSKCCLFGLNGLIIAVHGQDAKDRVANNPANNDFNNIFLT